MPSSIINNGGTFFQPGIYSSIVVDNTGNVELGAKNLAVVGEFPELEPNNAKTYKVKRGYSIQDYIPAPSSGLKKLEKIWKNTVPTELAANISSSTSITYINARQSTQATKAHKVGTTYRDIVANEQIGNLKSKIWGSKGLQTTITIDKVGSAFKVIGKALGGAEVQLTSNDEYNEIITLTNKAAFSVAVRIKDRKLSICKADAGASPFAPINELDLSEFATVDDLFNALIATGVFGTGEETDGTASKAKFYGVLPLQLDELRGSLNLATSADFDSAQSELEDAGALDLDNFVQVAAGSTLTLSASTQGLIDLINVQGASVFPFEYALINANKRVPFANLPELTDVAFDEGGGSNGSAASTADYETALAACVDEDFLTITCLSDDIDVHLALKTHIDDAIEASRFRNAWVGATVSQDKATINALQVNLLNSPHISVVGQSISIDKDGLLDPKWTAFFMMCLQGALPVGEPLTRKIPNILSTSEVWNRDRKVEIEDAIKKGIVVIHKDITDDFRIARSITTYKKDNQSVNCEVSARESANYCVLDLQKYLLSQIGSKILLSSKNRLETLANQRLIEQRNLGFIKDFKNVVVSVVADTANITFDLAVVEPLNFIKITANVRQF